MSRYGASGWVRALQVVGGDLHVGGWFTTAGSVRAERVALLDPATGGWSTLGRASATRTATAA